MISAAVVWVPKNCQRYTNLSKPVELVSSGAERRRSFSRISSSNSLAQLSDRGAGFRHANAS